MIRMIGVNDATHRQPRVSLPKAVSVVIRWCCRSNCAKCTLIHCSWELTLAANPRESPAIYKSCRPKDIGLSNSIQFLQHLEKFALRIPVEYLQEVDCRSPTSVWENQPHPSIGSVRCNATGWFSPFSNVRSQDSACLSQEAELTSLSNLGDSHWTRSCAFSQPSL